MRLLILGGTRFLGRHLAEQALAAGHDVTVLHRGRSGPELFAQARHLIADRNADLAVLDGGRWDVAIDTNAYVPRHVQSVAAKLAGRVAQYQMVSTISVYRSSAEPGQDEDAPLQTLDDPATETVDGSTYGGLKVACEQAAVRAFGDRATLIPRPGLLVGPHDPTDRFTWWLRRLQRAGSVLAPGPATAPVQCIDARDAAAWMLQQAEAGSSGVFNLTGPPRPAGQPLTMGELLELARALLAPAAQLVWVDEGFALAAGVAPWSDWPLWLPQGESGLHRTRIERAVQAGLQCRPLAQTITDTAAWAASLPARPVPPGLAPEREAALLAAWLQRQ